MGRDEARRVGRERLLGDRLDTALKATGIHQTVQTVARLTGWDCGCAKRTAALNRWHAQRGR